MIICKSPAEIEKMRKSGQVVRQVLLETSEKVRPGVTTLELEKFVEKRLANCQDEKGWGHLTGNESRGLLWVEKWTNCA